MSPDMTIFVVFFQAEDGIRDRDVTGVQTCALPDLHAGFPALHVVDSLGQVHLGRQRAPQLDVRLERRRRQGSLRSEERRVGKEWRTGWSAYDEKKRETMATRISRQLSVFVGADV